MGDIFKQLLQGIDLSRLGSKVFMLLLLAGTVAVIVVLWLWTQKSDFQVLYSNLGADDTGTVLERLKDMGVSYRLSQNGDTILVPSNQVHQIRLQLASDGLPQGGTVGFEIFDRSTIGSTEFVQKLNYRRALQGELSRTISQLKEVSKARVHLVVPERTLFASEEESPRASVVLSLVSGRRMSEKQVQGIVHLVASAVDRLEPHAVTVIDHHGRLLSRKFEDSSSFAHASSTQLEYQHQFERQLEGKIRSLLEPIVGLNKAIVRVSSDLELRQVEITEEKYDPETQVARSEQKTQEKLIGSSQAPEASGVPGALPAVPGGGGTGITSQNSSEKKNEVVNYEISKTISRIIEPVGSIQKLSVAVLVDGTYETITNDAGETTRNYIPRTDEEMEKLEDLVKGSMGYSEERNDHVEVANIPFLSEELIGEGEMGAGGSIVDQILPWWPLMRYILGVGLIATIILFVIRPIIKELLSRPIEAPPALSEESLKGLQAPSVAPAVSERDQAIAFTKENPQAAAAMVKKWIKEK